MVRAATRARHRSELLTCRRAALARSRTVCTSTTSRIRSTASPPTGRPVGCGMHLTAGFLGARTLPVSGAPTVAAVSARNRATASSMMSLYRCRVVTKLISENLTRKTSVLVSTTTRSMDLCRVRALVWMALSIFARRRSFRD